MVLNHVLGMWGWWLPDQVTATTKSLLAPSDMSTGKFSFEFAEKVFKVNIFSYMQLATLAMPALVQSKGRLVVVSSGAGKMGLPKVAPYSASKHALVISIHDFFPTTSKLCCF